MRRALKWIGLGLAGLIGLLVVAVVILILMTDARLNRTYRVPAESLAIPTDAAALERGRHWVEVSCAGCHGEDLGGTAFFEDPGLGRIPASNLTRGRGGVGASYADEDWVRALRHGVGADGKPLLIMPSAAFWWLGDADLAGIVAYVKGVPPVDREMAEKSLTPMGKVLVALGILGNISGAETIDHDLARPATPARGATPEYGAYLVRVGDCRLCHGPELSGGQPPEPGSPPGPALTRAGSLGGWSEETFLSVIRTRQSRFMPYQSFARLTDDELRAIWAYLGSLE